MTKKNVIAQDPIGDGVGARKLKVRFSLSRTGHVKSSSHPQAIFIRYMKEKSLKLNETCLFVFNRNNPLSFSWLNKYLFKQLQVPGNPGLKSSTQSS